MKTAFTIMRDELREHYSPEERRLLVKAVAMIESNAAKGTPLEYAWNRVWRQVDWIKRQEEGANDE